MLFKFCDSLSDGSPERRESRFSPSIDNAQWMGPLRARIPYETRVAICGVQYIGSAVCTYPLHVLCGAAKTTVTESRCRPGGGGGGGRSCQTGHLTVSCRVAHNSWTPLSYVNDVVTTF